LLSLFIVRVAVLLSIFEIKFENTHDCHPKVIKMLRLSVKKTSVADPENFWGYFQKLQSRNFQTSPPPLFRFWQFISDRASWGAQRKAKNVWGKGREVIRNWLLIDFQL
jgi:hypothetical protein